MSLSSTLINEIPTQVLIVDDSAADRNLVRLSLQEATKFYSLDCAERLSEGLEKLSNSQPHVILLDLNLPDSQGNEGVQKVLHKAPDVPILVLTGADDDRMAVEAVRHGAQDYIVKGQMDSHELTRAMEQAGGSNSTSKINSCPTFLMNYVHRWRVFISLSRSCLTDWRVH
jgi:DNA-binding response OmpR family regulator